MTFNEYINQTTPKRSINVQITKDDCYHTYNVYNGLVIMLLIGGEYYSYLLPKDRIFNLKSSLLYTMDNDGNKKSLSCFRFNANIV